MAWWITKQNRIAIQEGTTVAELIDMLKKCPQNYPVCNADGGFLCEICIVMEGSDKQVQIY